MNKKPDSAPSKKRGPNRSARREAAEAAGLSRADMWRCIMVANIPSELFEAMVESDNPPTVTELVELSRRLKGYAPRSVGLTRRQSCPHCGGDLTTDRRSG